MSKSQLLKDFMDEFYWLDDAPAKRICEWFWKQFVDEPEKKDDLIQGLGGTK
jgi:hypothetical protein